MSEIIKEGIAAMLQEAEQKKDQADQYKKKVLADILTAKEAFKVEKVQMEQEKLEVQNSISALKKEKEDLENWRETLQGFIMLDKSTLSDLAKEKEQVGKQISEEKDIWDKERSKDLEQLMQEEVSLKSEIDALKICLIDLQKFVEEKKGESQKLSEEVSVKREEASNEIKILVLRSEEIKVKLLELESKYKIMLEQYDAVNTEVAEVFKLKQDILALVDELRANKEGLEKSIQNMTEEILQVQKDKDQANLDMKKASEWNNELKILEKALLNRKIELDKKEQVLREAHKELM